MPTYDGKNGLNFSDAPTGDIALDDLFPPEGAHFEPTTAPAEPQATEPQAQPVETLPDEYFLKTPTGTVYKTQEDAARGVAQKDDLIATLRERYKKDYGIDPLKEDGTVQQPPPRQPEPPQNVDLWKKLEAAAKTGDTTAWNNTMETWLQAKLEAQLQPYIPIVQQGAVARAQEEAASRIPGFREFRNSPDFEIAASKLPIVKQAIEMSEQNIQAAGQLPQLYELVYLVNQGLKAAEIARTGAHTPNPAPTARPTQTPSTMTPPPPAGTPDLRTHEGRKNLIEAAERRGIGNANWRDLGF
jgi:hypothetical protein